MKYILTLIIIPILTLSVHGQVDPAIWDSLKNIKTENYEFKVPYKWRQMSAIGDQEEYIDADGLMLPATFNGSPVIVTVFVFKQEATSVEDAKNKRIEKSVKNRDREFADNIKYNVEKIKLSSGQDAYFLSTRFHRKSKHLNQSRFSLVVYSEKSKMGYSYTLAVEYNDSSYKFETDNNLSEFAKKLYGYFNLY